MEILTRGLTHKRKSLFRLRSLLASRDTQRLIGLSIVMEVTVDGMDAVVEPIGIYSRRVTGMTVFNPY